MIKILIAEDHAIVRNGLRQIFSDSTDLEVLGYVNKGRLQEDWQ